MRAYHGTTDRALTAIRTGSALVAPVYVEANASLGGAYLAVDRSLAIVAAQAAARSTGGRPVLLIVEIAQDELLPDEDWVVRAAEAREDVHRGRRIDDFMTDLFEGYPGEGFSLSDHYRDRYDELNDTHTITWRDSWTWSRTARIARLLTAADVVASEDLGA